ncbi:MAG TPA: sulfatase [Lacipirellulaceae bacterium]|nr:sulfatase [Lacipirellulaceae bacterium]
MTQRLATTKSGARYAFRLLPAFATLLLVAACAHPSDSRPNVLLLVVDDLNHWIGSLHRHPQARTPNIDRLAARGVNFTHAYCPSPLCSPSRAALMSGKRTATIGVYSNMHKPWRNYTDERQCLNAYFRAQGYYTAGAGKIYHLEGGIKNSQGTEWDDYVVRFGHLDLEHDEPPATAKQKQQRYVNGPKALKQPPRPGNIKVGTFEIGAPNIADSETEDFKIAEWGARQLAQKRDRPFFLALGFRKPHPPWTVPKKYFDLFPLDSIKLPPHIANDLDDLPPAGKKWVHDASWVSVMDAGSESAWKQIVQGYLASVAYIDAQVGMVVDALEKSPHKDNTIVVLFGDHGWHLGEKEHFGKATLWEEATRAPLIWVAPGVTKPGSRCDATVEFLSIYPTLCDLAGLPKPDFLEGVSMRPLLANPQAEWTRPALSTFGFNNHSVRSVQYRYIRYANGDEELYDEKADPYEWTNLAANPELGSVKADLARWMPKENKPDSSSKPIHP